MNTVPKMPPNHRTVMPYLILSDASRFLTFIVDVFQASILLKVMDEHEKIKHAEAGIGDSTICFADAPDTYLPNPTGLFLYVWDADETYHKALQSGATALTPLQDQPYGRSGGIIDPVGNTWWITSVK